MALKACKECGKEIAANAMKCPHCGWSEIADHLDNGFKGCFWTVLVLVLIVGGWVVFS